MIIPLYILYATRYFTANSSGQAKAMKLMVSRAVARAAVNLSGFDPLTREGLASSSQSTGGSPGAPGVLPFVADGIDHNTEMSDHQD
jgi:hypothetical protein